MNSFYTYILICNDGSYYIGHTDNIEKRIAEHSSGSILGYTQTRLPVELVFVQEFSTRDEAFNAEHQVKKWNRKKKEALIQSDWNSLRLLSKKKFY
jgi:tRNA/rRNA methyltransferase